MCSAVYGDRDRIGPCASSFEGMFERFTERARQVVVLAQEEARTLGHGWIGTEHLLLALMRATDGVAAIVLANLGVGPEDEVRKRVVEAVGPGRVRSGQIPFTQRAKTVLELSLREAMGMNHNYISTEHVLLALVRENEGIAANVLRSFGADAETIRHGVMRVLATPGYAKTHEGEIAKSARAQVMAVPPAPPASLGRVLQRASAEAQNRRERTFDTGDVLLGLAIDADSVAGRALASLAVDAEALRVALDEIRGGGSDASPPTGSGPPQ
jgi:ATP-dependent Clp protease ATP-binding subunit ClpA